jgi:hypothetical protein
MKSIEMSWRERPAASAAYVTGDIRRVIYSRADVLYEVPPVTNGLGALSVRGPQDAGEGIVFRGQTVLTSPNSDAGTRLSLLETRKGIAAPFFIGWTGEASGVGKFHSPEGISLYEIYESLLGQVNSVFAEHANPLVFAEIVGLLRPRDIHDRALMKPVNTGDVLTTSPEYAPEYYKTKIISDDLDKHGLSADELIPLCLVGAGYDPQLAAESFRDSGSLIFYTPPTLAGSPSPQEPGAIKTHSHALGWRRQPELNALLLSATVKEVAGPTTPESDEWEALPVPATTPDYIVHLDDWSVFTAGVVRVFVTPPDKISFGATPVAAG